MAEMTLVRFRLTHKQKDQFESAAERYRENEDLPTLSQEAILRRLVKRFCKDQGVGFSPFPSCYNIAS